MSKKNRALSDENLGQVSGGAVTLSDGTKLTGDEAAWYMQNRFGSHGGSGKTTPVPPPVDSTVDVVEAVEPMESFDGPVVG